MKPPFRSIFLLLTLLVAFSISSCSVGRRLYFGEPLPRSGTALFYTRDGKTSIHSVEVPGKPIMNFAGLFMGELAPGRYTLCVAYSDIDPWVGGKRVQSKGCYDLMLDAQGGHVYYIYADFPGPNQWQPRIIDITRTEDYKKIEDGDAQQRRVEKYFQGERQVISQSEAMKKFNVWE